MLAKLKKFDIHVKSLEGVNRQTLLGAVLTILGTILVLGLVVNEISIFRQIHVVSKLQIDKGGATEAVKLVFDVSFNRLPCNRINFYQEATRGTVHTHEPAEIVMQDMADGPNVVGCRVTGYEIIDKLSGNFRFAVSPSAAKGANDLSHVVNFVSFEPASGKQAAGRIPDVASNISQLVTTVPEGTVIYQYSMQVIPTEYKELWGELYHTNQYTLSEKALSEAQAQRGDPYFPVPVHNFVGILFSYDFHPVRRNDDRSTHACPPPSLTIVSLSVRFLCPNR